MINIDEADRWLGESLDYNSGVIDQPMFIYNSDSIMHAQGPRRTAEYPGVIADRNINKHQEKITHNDTCLCKESNYNDLVVMYCHIEQYPQFRCYCKWCLGKLASETHNMIKQYGQDKLNEAWKIILLEEIRKLGVDLKLD